jgi:hypothetical protein
MSFCAKSVEAPLAAESGRAAPARVETDPYAALDDLMAAVEALCAVWPPRPGFADGGAMRL